MLCERRFHYLVDDNRFVQQSSQDVVILDAVLELLHESYRLAFDDLAGLKLAIRDHVAIHVAAIAGISADHEPVGEGIRVGDDLAVLKRQRLLIVIVLPSRARFILHEDPN